MSACAKSIGPTTLARLMRSWNRRDWLGVGMLAAAIALLALAGTSAAAGLPWYAVLTLPILFAAGMSTMDTADGLFMTLAYDWAFAHPARKIFDNLTITGLSVAVALLIGTIELVSVLHDNLNWINPITNWVSALNLNNVGFTIVGLFVAAWACAIAYWRVTGAEHRWQIAQPSAPSE